MATVLGRPEQVITTETQDESGRALWGQLPGFVQALLHRDESHAITEAPISVWPLSLNRSDFPGLPWESLEISREESRGKTGYVLTKNGPNFLEDTGVRVFLFPQEQLQQIESDDPRVYYSNLQQADLGGRKLALDGPRVAVSGENLVLVVKKRFGQEDSRSPQIPDLLRVLITKEGLEEQVVDRVIPWDGEEPINLSKLTSNNGRLMITEPEETKHLLSDEDGQVDGGFTNINWRNQLFLPGRNVVLLTNIRRNVRSSGPQPPYLQIEVESTSKGLEWVVSHHRELYERLLLLREANPSAFWATMNILKIPTLETLAKRDDGIDAITAGGKLYRFYGESEIRAPITPGEVGFWEDFMRTRRSLVRFGVEPKQSGIVLRLMEGIQPYEQAERLTDKGRVATVFTSPYMASVYAREMAGNHGGGNSDKSISAKPKVKMDADVERVNSGLFG